MKRTGEIAPVAAIARFAAEQSVSVVDFQKGSSRDDVMGISVLHCAGVVRRVLGSS
jgi:hypothetical protein